MYNAKVLADSYSSGGVRLTTFEVTFPRFILAEFNTHRMLCLAGDAQLEFDLPAGGRRGYRRVYRMRLDAFVDNWLHGGRRIGTKPKSVRDLAWVEDNRLYSAREITNNLAFADVSTVHSACRAGRLAARRGSDGRSWLAYGHDIRRWRDWSPEHTRFDIRPRLSAMRIRQLNEITGDIQLSHVVGACESGEKEVFELVAGDYRVAGSRDHRVLTASGWRHLGDVTPGDFVVVRKHGKRDADFADSLRLRKIDGQWRSVWQRQMRDELISQSPQCRWCGIRSGTTIHHIVPVYQDASRALDRSNITLLCDECHADAHRKQGWQGGTYLYGALAEVETVALRGIEPTYDLAIAGDFPNFLASGVVVHNSRNSASSRAIPTEKIIEMVRTNPFVPDFNRRVKGMGVGEPLSAAQQAQTAKEWLRARDEALRTAERLLDIDKSRVNRILEPYMWHTALVTATDWGNFFGLRTQPTTQPEFRTLALMMQEAMRSNTPWYCPDDCWHLPLCDLAEMGDPIDYAYWKWVCTGRCARVSYLTHDGQRDPAQDVGLHNRLLADRHLSPFEHVARPFSDQQWEIVHEQQEDLRDFHLRRHPKLVEMWCRQLEYCANFRGWTQYRLDIPGQQDYSLALSAA